ncbi:MAG: hypothetical protein KDD43_03765, partial [Bdellovibrionales bacterium]|nr:hypothetical protein [Bdellovibrionales bacterium]
SNNSLPKTSLRPSLKTPQTRNNSPLGNYLQKAPKDSPLPDIDITLSHEDLNNNDILSVLCNLQSSDKTFPIKAVIEVKNPSELQSLIDNQLPLLQENHSLFRAISIKNVSTQQLQGEIAPLVKLLQYTIGPQITPTIKHFPLRTSLTIPTINEFLATDFSSLPKNLQIYQLTIDNNASKMLKEHLTKAQNPQFQQQLNNLKHVTALNLQIAIAKDATLTIPACVTTLTTGTIYGTLQFAPDSQCSQLSINYIWKFGTVTVPPSVTALNLKTIYGTLPFAPDSQYSKLYLGEISSSYSITIPSSVTTLTAAFIKGTLQFAPDCQCTSLSFGYIHPKAIVTIPSSVTTLTAAGIGGTLQFAPDSQCTSLSLGSIYPQGTVTVPPSVTTLTINKTTYSGQQLLDLKSRKTSLPRIRFKSPSIMETLAEYLHINELFNMFRSS